MRQKSTLLPRYMSGRDGLLDRGAALALVPA